MATTGTNILIVAARQSSGSKTSNPSARAVHASVTDTVYCFANCRPFYSRQTQVVVRTTPESEWTSLVTMLLISSRVDASRMAITSYGPVTLSMSATAC